LESTVRIKLDGNRLQIKHLIEAKQAINKEIFESELLKSTKELRQTIEAEAANQSRQLFA
jgi:hypothetical protein